MSGCAFGVGLRSPKGFVLFTRIDEKPDPEFKAGPVELSMLQLIQFLQRFHRGRRIAGCRLDLCQFGEFGVCSFSALSEPFQHACQRLATIKIAVNGFELTQCFRIVLRLRECLESAHVFGQTNRRPVHLRQFCDHLW